MQLQLNLKRENLLKEREIYLYEELNSMPVFAPKHGRSSSSRVTPRPRCWRQQIFLKIIQNWKFDGLAKFFTGEKEAGAEFTMPYTIS